MINVQINTIGRSAANELQKQRRDLQSDPRNLLAVQGLEKSDMVATEAQLTNIRARNLFNRLRKSGSKTELSHFVTVPKNSTLTNERNDYSPISNRKTKPAVQFNINEDGEKKRKLIELKRRESKFLAKLDKV